MVMVVMMIIRRVYNHFRIKQAYSLKGSPDVMLTIMITRSWWHFL